MIDVHQHLWPEAFVERLRARSSPPYLDGWTLHLSGEPPYDVDPAAHAIEKRLAAERDAGTTLAVLAPSSPLGIEHLGDDLLLAAWNHADFPAFFAIWAAVDLREPRLDGLKSLAGVQIPAGAVRSPHGWEAVAPILAWAEDLGKPVLVHPGASVVPLRDVPEWWAPVVDYTAQLQAAWWGWHAYGGRRQFPKLRVCFAAAAGLAPVHHERLTARGGRLGTIDPNVFVDTSGYGPQAIDAVARVLGIDQIVHGTDRPYAGTPDLRQLGDAAIAAIRHDNPHRLLFGARPGGVQ